jgi:hypothetical protein
MAGWRRRDAFKYRYAEGDAQKQPPMKETANEHFPSSKPLQWAWLDLNQRPHPQVKMP